jgi:hypothetical protein
MAFPLRFTAIPFTSCPDTIRLLHPGSTAKHFTRKISINGMKSNTFPFPADDDTKYNPFFVMLAFWDIHPFSELNPLNL